MNNETINHLIHDRNVRGQTQTGSRGNKRA